MKTLPKFLSVVAVVAFSFAPVFIRAQDAPPPPDDQGQGGPGPGDQPPTGDQGQGDQGQGDQGQGDQGQGDQGASFQTFYDQLGNQGNWVQTDDYGYVFQPNVSDPNWAPYTDGHWVYTDVGWMWVSDEPWGWATYHYGRWCNIDGTGWCWVPGYRWAPAWVSWRYGGGYCGWAPLPPETFIGVEFGGGGGVFGGFHFGGDVDVNFNIGAGCYNFVGVGDLGEPNYRGRYIDRSRNYTVINNTTNITNIIVNKPGAGGNFRGVNANGPSITEVNAHSHQQIPTVQLTRMNQAGRSNLQGNSLAVYAPSVNPATMHAAKPARVSETVSHPVFNRGDSITKPLAVNASLRPAAPSPQAIQEARNAQMHAPSTARIATEKTRSKEHFSKPLTSMQPVTQAPKTAKPTESNGMKRTDAVNPTTPRSTAGESPYTGETAKPKATEKPEKEMKPATTYHPENGGNQNNSENQVKPKAVHHTENEVQPKTTEKPRPEKESKPATTYHPKPETHKPAPSANRPPPGGGQGNKPSGGGNKAPASEKKPADEKKP